MMQSGFIVVIDIGTSTIKGVVGRKNESGVISIMACESINSGNSVRRGMVYNIEEVGAIVRKLVTMLENSIGKRIGKAYVSLSGQSLHTLEFREVKPLSPSGIVSEEVVNQLHSSASKYSPDLKRSYGVADVEYLVDQKPERNPVGVTGSRIEACYQLIVGRPNLQTNIEKSVTGKAKLPVSSFIVGALASAEVALNEEDKELGCAFVNFGAGTTSISIYKRGILRRMVVIPFGGKNITKDICALNFTENDAEQLKIKFGKAFENHESPFFSSPFSSKPDVDLTELNRVIGLRLDERSANIRDQVHLSGFEHELCAGLIITGGASQLKNLPEYLTQKLKMPVRRVAAKSSLINNAPDLINDPSFTQVLGMLLLGQDNCEMIPEQKEVASNEESYNRRRKETNQSSKEGKKSKKNQKQGIFSKFEDVFGNMFSEEDE